jgi:hypothetical protein
MRPLRIKPRGNRGSGVRAVLELVAADRLVREREPGTCPLEESIAAQQIRDELAASVEVTVSAGQIHAPQMRGRVIRPTHSRRMLPALRVRLSQPLAGLPAGTRMTLCPPPGIARIPRPLTLPLSAIQATGVTIATNELRAGGEITALEISRTKARARP